MGMSRKDRIGIFGSLAIFVFIFGVGAIIALSRGGSPDQATLCDPSVPKRSHRVIIVDKTDPLTPLALSNLEQTIREQRDLLAIQDRLWVFAMSSDGINIADPLFSKCRPASGGDVSSFTSNPSLVQARYDKSFEKPLDDTLQILLKSSTAAFSPILETFGRTAASPAFSGDRQRHILVVTDLLQNSALFSAYGERWKGRPKPQDLADQMFLNFGRVFDTVDLTVLVIDRRVPNVPRQKELQEYWRSIFRALGVSQLIIRSL
jgi:hypothetical protein